MRYFSTLPKVVYTDENNISRLYTNIIARASIKSSLLNNPLVYYTYDIQDEDTPEIVAHKYYGDSYRYWIVLYANQIIDPQWDWPLSQQQFEKFIVEKYTQFNPYGEAHHFEKIITQYDQLTLTTTKHVIQISEDDYDQLDTSTRTVNTTTGPVTITTEKRSVTYYQYELELNESKRNIKLLNKIYVDQFEREFNQLMSA